MSNRIDLADMINLARSYPRPTSYCPARGAPACTTGALL